MPDVAISFLSALILTQSLQAAEFRRVCTPKDDPVSKIIVTLEPVQANLDGEMQHSLAVLEQANPLEAQSQFCKVDEVGKIQRLMNGLDNQAEKIADEKVRSGKLTQEVAQEALFQIKIVGDQRNAIIDSQTSSVLICEQGPIAMLYAFDNGPSAMWFCVGGVGCGDIEFFSCEDIE